jgi:hydroxymethylpyrimidine pyrophosphatase-like HAD family hydrolase
MHQKCKMNLKKPIKAIILDIDGCLNSSAIGEAFDLQSLMEIQRLNKASVDNPAIPYLIINTGRALNYAEAFAQILDVKHYFCFEMGIAIAKIHGSSIEIHLDPHITENVLTSYRKLQNDFLKTYPKYQNNLQPGKQYMFTFLFEVDEPEIEICKQKMQNFIDQHSYELVVDTGHNFINIIYPHIDKGTGHKLLLSYEENLDNSEIAGIGDSNGDWNFLQHCVIKGTPSNGSKLLKEKCDIVASSTDVRGTLEIIYTIIGLNTEYLSKH